MLIFYLFLHKNRLWVLGEAVLTSKHTLCFGAKLRKVGIPLYTPVFFIKVGFRGVFITRTCFPDGLFIKSRVSPVNVHSKMAFGVVLTVKR